MKEKIVKVGILLISGLFLTACGSMESTELPAITSKPKLIIVEPATPTPTITLEQGEVWEEPVATNTPVPTAEQGVTVTPTPKPTATATPKPTKKPTATPVPTKAEKLSYEKGVLTENGFESKWMGLKFNAPKGVEMSTQEELDELMRLMEEALSGTPVTGELDYPSLGLVYELNLVWQDEGMILQLMVERVSESATVEEYMDQMKEELDLIEESGLTYMVDDRWYEEKIGGKTFYNYGHTVYYDEVGMRQENYFRKQDDRIILMSIMCEDDTTENIPKLLEAFIPY